MANDDEPGVLLVLLALAAAVYAAAWMTEPDREPQPSPGAEMTMPVSARFDHAGHRLELCKFRK